MFWERAGAIPGHEAHVHRHSPSDEIAKDRAILVVQGDPIADADTPLVVAEAAEVQPRHRQSGVHRPPGVLKVLEERSEMESPHGKISLAILILQDIVAVPMVLMTPLMAGSQGDSASMFLALLLKGIAIVALAIISARFVVPHILYQIAKTRSRELFLIAVVVICLSVAWATSSIGLSLALGAFLAGLIISESEYNYQALGTLLPFRDLFTSIFFISIGMLVDTDIFVERPWTILAGALGVAILKTLTAGGAAAILRYPLRPVVPARPLCYRAVGLPQPLGQVRHLPG